MDRAIHIRREEEARDGHDLLVRVFWGRKRAVTMRAIAFAVALFVVVAIFEYANMAAYENVVYFDIPRASWDYGLWGPFRKAFRHPGLIIGLAAVHAYLNEGYLPSVLLASAPIHGVKIWVYYGPHPGPYVLILRPLVGYWEWALGVPLYALPLATLGFIVGFVVRWLRTEVLDFSEPI